MMPPTKLTVNSHISYLSATLQSYCNTSFIDEEIKPQEGDPWGLPAPLT